jgi:hypothetical protein
MEKRDRGPGELQSLAGQPSVARNSFRFAPRRARLRNKFRATKDFAIILTGGLEYWQAGDYDHNYGIIL